MKYLNLGTENGPNFQSISDGAFYHHNAIRSDPYPTLERVGIVPGTTVIDLGCGEGYYILPIASLVGVNGTVYAVDKNLQSLFHLRENVRAFKIDKSLIKIINEDMAHTGIPDRIADTIFISNAFHDVKNVSDLMDEIRRLLKPSGVIVILDWKKKKTLFGPPYDMRWAEKEVKLRFEKYGFELIDVFYPDKYHYCLSFNFTESKSLKSNGGAGKEPVPLMVDSPTKKANKRGQIND